MRGWSKETEAKCVSYLLNAKTFQRLKSCTYPRLGHHSKRTVNLTQASQQDTPVSKSPQQKTDVRSEKHKNIILLHFTYELFLSRKDLPCLLLEDFSYMHCFDQIRLPFPLLQFFLSCPNTLTALASCAVVLDALSLLNAVCMCTGVGLSTRAWVASQGHIPEENELFFPQQRSAVDRSSVGLYEPLPQPCWGFVALTLCESSTCTHSHREFMGALPRSCPANTLLLQMATTCGSLKSFCPFF